MLISEMGIQKISKSCQHAYIHKDPMIPPCHADRLKSVFENFCDCKFLQKCNRGKTQNVNESLHSVIWSMLPKTVFTSNISVELCCSIAVCQFNNGSRLGISRCLEAATGVSATGAILPSSSCPPFIETCSMMHQYTVSYNAPPITFDMCQLARL